MRPTKAIVVNGYIFLAMYSFIWSCVSSLFLCFFNHVESDNWQNITFDPYCIMVGLRPKNILKASEIPRGFIIVWRSKSSALFKTMLCVNVLGVKLQNGFCENITWKCQFTLLFL